MGVYFVILAVVAGAALLLVRSATRNDNTGHDLAGGSGHKNFQGVLHEQGMQKPVASNRRSKNGRAPGASKKPWGW